MLVYHAQVYYWLCDEAYVGFRYVYNWRVGNGLVFNRGYPTEGCASFLWMLNLAAARKCTGWWPETASVALGGLYTAGVTVLTLLLVRSTPFTPLRAVIGWAAVFLLAINRAFAIWTTGGLETRQFTFFVLLSIWLLRGYRERSARLVYASCTLALTEYVCPEGLLIAGLCMVWYLFDARLHARLRWRDALRLAIPFAVLVSGHYLFRYVYYGNLLPSTYHTNHPEPGPDAGLCYFVAAGIENGLYVLLPLAVLGLYARLRLAQDSVHALSLLCIGAHMLYVVRIGGDRFEFRALDFYWPLLTVAALEGVGFVASGLASHSVAPAGTQRRLLAVSLTLAGTLVLAAYGTVFQFGKYCLTYDACVYDQDALMLDGITRENYPAAYLLPGCGSLVPLYNSSLRCCRFHAIAVTQQAFKADWQRGRAQWSPYLAIRGRHVIPPDAVGAAKTTGIMPYFLGDLTVIDESGRDDRGVNIDVQPAVCAVSQTYAPPPRQRTSGSWFPLVLRIRDDVWMPFSVRDRAWAVRAFAGRDVREWRTVRPIGMFASGTAEGWEFSGDAMLGNPRYVPDPDGTGPAKHVIFSWPPGLGDAATGAALSPAFTAEPDTYLEFRIAGGSTNVGMELLVDGEPAATWTGENSEELRYVSECLTPLVGRTIQLRVFDSSTAGWGHIRVDDVCVMAACPLAE